MVVQRADDVLTYWFAEADRDELTLDALKSRLALWFGQSDETDAVIRARFGDLLVAASRGELDHWAETPRGRLALVVVLDQFPRNIHRGSPSSFATDAAALALVEAGLELGVDGGFNEAHRVAFYLPLMHAEDRARATRSRGLYQRLFDAAPERLRPALALVHEASERHFRIVDRFGRYPHRNETLARTTTPEEAAFLSGPDASFAPKGGPAGPRDAKNDPPRA